MVSIIALDFMMMCFQNVQYQDHRCYLVFQILHRKEDPELQGREPDTQTLRRADLSCCCS